MDEILLAVVLAAAMTLYVTKWLPMVVTSLLLPPALVATGILTVPEALSGFSNAATLTIGALFVVSAGLERTGTLDLVTAGLKRLGGGSLVRVFLALAVCVPFVSAFMNNIPVVAMFVPVVLALSRDLDVKPSKLMIPLSFLAILGGTCTLVGTGTNLLVHEVFRTWQRDHGLVATGLGMFEFAPLGLLLLGAGALFLLTLGLRLLPERTSLSALLPQERAASFYTEILVDEASALDGAAAREAFPPDGPVRLLQRVRGERIASGAAAHAGELRAGDALLVTGKSAAISEFLAQTRTSVAPSLEGEPQDPVRTVELQLAEAVVLPDSPFRGRTVKDLGLVGRFAVRTLAVQRGGKHLRAGVGSLRLQAGDVLLLQGTVQGFGALRDSGAVLIVEGLEGAIRLRGRAPLAVAILLLVVVPAAVTSVPIVVLALAGAALMIATRCLRPHEAFRALDPSVLLLLAGTIPLGVALETTGMARDLVHWMVNDVLRGASPGLILGGLYLVTSLVTSVLSNKATAVLLAPIALQLAVQLDVDPRPFLFAICFAASASFATPIGYPTNLIVLGPGGYQFRDFLFVGGLMNLLTWLLASLLIPVLWPF